MQMPLVRWQFFLVVGTLIVVQFCVMMMMPLQTVKMSADDSAFPRMISPIEPIEYSNDSAYEGAYRWSRTRGTVRLFGRTMPVAQVLRIDMHHGRSKESPVELALTQRKTTQKLMLTSGWRRNHVLVFADDRAGVYREVDWSINAEPIESDPRELGVAVRHVTLTDTTWQPSMWPSLLRFLYVGLLWLWIVILCYWRRWPWWSVLILPSVVLATIGFAPVWSEVYIPTDWFALWLGYGALATLWLGYRLAMVMIRLRVWEQQMCFQLPILALLLLIAVGSNLVLSPASVAYDTLIWTCTVALVGSVLGLLFPRSAHAYLLFIVLSILVIGVGLFESAVVVLWFVSSWSLGVLILERLRSKEHPSLMSATEAVLIGAVIWIAVWGGMLHFAVNYQSLHIVLCLLPCLFVTPRYSSIRNEVRAGVIVAQEWLHSIPYWAWVLGVAVIGWVLRWASWPTVTYDDHINHLRMWTELLTLHRYSFDVTVQVMSIMPFTVNMLHAGLSLMTGSDARSAMNLSLAILLLFHMAGILRTLKFPAWLQWLLMVLTVSTPMLGWLLFTLQTELMLAVVALAGMRLVLDSYGGWRGQYVMGILSSAALCASIKLPGVVLGVTLLVALAVLWWSQREAATPTGQIVRWPTLLLLIPLSFVALHSYAVAWVITGNPVFPVYNGVFLSPYHEPVNYFDSRWYHGFSFTSYVRAFFYTSEYGEYGNYTAGWQYLMMLPLAIFALFRSGTPIGLRIILIPVLGFGLVMFSSTQYWRYLFPVMPLAVILLGALFIQENPVFRKIAFAFAVTCIVANLFFFTGISHMMNHSAGMGFTRDGDERLKRLYAPEVLLTERVNILAPGSRVLYTASPYGATLHGSPIFLTWEQPFSAVAFRKVKDFDGLRNFLSKEQVDFAILAKYVYPNYFATRGGHHNQFVRHMPLGFQYDLLREYMAQYGYVEGAEKNTLLYRVSDAPVQYRKVFELHPSEAEEAGNVELLIPKTDQGVKATGRAEILAFIPTFRARQARYTVEFRCLSEIGSFFAQIHWDKGSPYDRLVACEGESVKFVQAIPIPIGASQGTIYVETRGTSSIQVTNMTVEVN